jgi:phage-related protein
MVAEEMDILPATYFTKLADSDDIWECRVQFGSDNCRILCFHVGGSVLVLTHGFMKKTRKTPAKEIARAETCKGEYLRRYKCHE